MPSFFTLIGTACVGALVLSTGVSAGTHVVSVAGRVRMHRQAEVVDRSQGAGIVAPAKRDFNSSSCSLAAETKHKSKSDKHAKTATSTKKLTKVVKAAVQGGAVPRSTVASAADPYLTALSLPLNNKANPLFTKKRHGVMTYYGQGLGACGDTYDDSTYTAAVSHLIYDKWPGATSATNSNGICGRFVKGRYYITSADEVVKGTSHATMGGDGLLSCTPNEQCHIPLTVTISYPVTGATIVVKVTDRCPSCAEDHIDLAPAAFLKLTAPHLNTAGFKPLDFMAEASKNVLGIVPGIVWSFN